jgi:hypothetical protein
MSTITRRAPIGRKNAWDLAVRILVGVAAVAAVVMPMIGMTGNITVFVASP